MQTQQNSRHMKNWTKTQWKYFAFYMVTAPIWAPIAVPLVIFGSIFNR
jgi:hypothetical protein